ncbi:MAG: sugar phosphate isomerase/epimerase [Lachnospiraceae bacterium]|nr:sugar phosphate isomerase/epimerase [Lachnospiraceae bacterium]
MRLSTSTCMYFNRPGGLKAPIPESIRLLSEAGYRVLDMNFHDCAVFETPFTGERWEYWLEEVLAMKERCGVVFSQGHSHFYNYCDETLAKRPYLEELIRRGIVAAGRLGIDWLVIHAATDFDSARPFESSRRKALEYFKPLLELAAAHHVGIAIENLWDLNIAPRHRYTATAEELADLIDRLPYDNVGACWDVEHASIMEQNQTACLKLLGKRVKATHISDHNGKENDHLLPFMGVMDWQEVMQALRGIGYAGDFTFETHRFTQEIPDALIPAALRYSRQVGEYVLTL